MKMRQMMVVGTYDLGAEAVELALVPGVSGGFSTRSGPKRDKRRMARIEVGADYLYWWEVVTCLQHEAKEFCDMRMGCRWEPDIDYSNNAAGYLFVETHAQHGEICARVGYLFADCLPDLAKAWKQWKKERNKKRGVKP